MSTHTTKKFLKKLDQLLSEFPDFRILAADTDGQIHNGTKIILVNDHATLETWGCALTQFDFKRFNDLLEAGQ